MHRHFLPFAAFIFIALILEGSSIDLWLADRLYALSGNAWGLRDNWITRELIHDGGRLFVGVMDLGLLLLTVASCFVTRLKPYRRGFGYLVVCVLACGLAINLLKEITHIDCPWDLLRYGGEFPYVRNFEPHPRSFRYGACFPAGHASAAYAWLGLYYFAREYAPRWMWGVLSGVLTLGLIFGTAQQLRGAHFLSHDLWTLGLCWLVVTVLSLLYFRAGCRVGAPFLERRWGTSA